MATGEAGERPASPVSMEISTTALRDHCRKSRHHVFHVHRVSFRMENDHHCLPFPERGRAEDSFSGSESRYKNIGIGDVFSHRVIFVVWRDRESVSFPVIKQNPKNTGGVNVRKAKPIDRSVKTHKSNRLQIPDDSVITYLLVHRLPSTSSLLIFFTIFEMKRENMKSPTEKNAS